LFEIQASLPSDDVLVVSHLDKGKSWIFRGTQTGRRELFGQDAPLVVFHAEKDKYWFLYRNKLDGGTGQSAPLLTCKLVQTL